MTAYAYVDEDGIAHPLPAQGTFTINGQTMTTSVFSFPDEDLALSNIFPIIDVPPPTTGANQKVVPTNNLLVGGPNDLWRVRREYLIEDETPADYRETLCNALDAERDARIDAGFTYSGWLFQSRPSDRENIAGAAQAAFMALANGADPMSYHWHGDPVNPFQWITADNSLVSMTAPEVIALFNQGVQFKSALTFYCRARKNWVLDPARTVPELKGMDVTAGWPA